MDKIKYMNVCSLMSTIYYVELEFSPDSSNYVCLIPNDNLWLIIIVIS